MGAIGRRRNGRASLFNEFRLKDVVLRNRIAVSPMCRYSSNNGFQQLAFFCISALVRSAALAW
jgi:2,4-dienoyl-CoA reductase-like NADH-dependent reductase (Old Yellow Enzyme family)